MWEEMIWNFSLTDNNLKIAFYYFLKQFKHATDRLDREDNALRAVLKEINMTFSLKVTIPGQAAGPSCSKSGQHSPINELPSSE